MGTVRDSERADARDSEQADARDSEQADARGWARQLGLLGHVGAMFPVAIGLGFMGGYWLDGRFGTAPWLALVGFGFGVVAAIRNLLRSLSALETSERAASSEKSDDT